MSKRVKAEDFIGSQFGELTVNEVFKKNDRSYCKCTCSCGEQTIVSFSNLRTGNTSSCGKHRVSFFYKNLLNQKFGRLTPIEKTEERKSGKIIWKCKCDCGNEVNVRSDYLLNGHTTSCGCLLSKGEEKIAQLLRENGIIFNQHKVELNCRFPDTNYPAIFDFYIEPDYRSKAYIKQAYFIEFDGIQHFQYIDNGHTWNTKEQFIKTQNNDKIKNEYCIKNNIPLIRIPYTYLDKLSIKDLLLNESKFIIRGLSNAE